MKNKLSGFLRTKLWFIPIIIIVIRLTLIGVTIFGKNSLLISTVALVVLLVLLLTVQTGLFNRQKHQRDDTQSLLMDAGDGAAEQLAKVGLTLASVQTIMIGQLDIEHTGGLYAILGMRFQERIASELTIYGPPGTQRMIDGILAGLHPLVRTRSAQVSHALQCTIIEITDGSLFTIGSTRITAAANTHYSFKPSSKNAFLYQSLSYRFDMPERSLVYTGDTGPSPNIERLAQHVDLLVSEVIDPHAEMNRGGKKHRIPFYAKPILMNHFKKQHLTAEAVNAIIRWWHFCTII